MKFKCKKSLYWHQVPGYSGHLSDEAVPNPYKDRPDLLPEKSSLVFEEGEEYDLEVKIGYNTLEYVSICAIGKDGEKYLLFLNEVNYGSTNLIRRHFFCD